MGSEDSICSLHRRFLSGITVKSLNVFYYTGSYAKVDYSVFMNVIVRWVLRLISIGLESQPIFISDYEVRLDVFVLMQVDEYSSHHAAKSMLLDQNMNLLENTQENRELYEQNLDKIENLYHEAYEMCGGLGK